MITWLPSRPPWRWRGSAESVGGNASTSSENGQTTLVVGSQDYYSNEIAEAAQAGSRVYGRPADRPARVYMPSLRPDGDVFP